MAFAMLFAACGGAGPDTTGPSVASITAAAFPTKTHYAVGEGFDSAGLTVTAVYDDGSSKNVTGWTLSWEGSPLKEGSKAITAEAGIKTVTVTYQGKTATFPITVGGGGSYTVSGVITKSDGGNAQGASVQLKSGAATIGNPVTVGTNGAYSIGGIPAGPTPSR
ncbi:MAG: bacterial Ig-like domain-containing protein [Treponema sp.]|jgi:hypothetical protein|nr:bacterial Ig-like domain-containing protein [Treponema sp.]